MEKVVNTRLAVVLLLGLLLAGQAAADAVEASSSSTQPPSSSTASKAGCEVPGTCDMKLGTAAADPTRPGAPANKYTRGCTSITKCRG
ncbi:hypothetical protein BAE44_0003007 [Dichanthelium oligosanthes]|uniref:Rapid alkalinization factor n=1 Tax=Dichanthelium oligosanthes TaxID=888268 RepID=A0A1E5WF37_9POAL|nr:hypothetical protein BAE44_0003007 [Dichanthelium oligosanthes]